MLIGTKHKEQLCIFWMWTVLQFYFNIGQIKILMMLEKKVKELTEMITLHPEGEINVKKSLDISGVDLLSIISGAMTKDVMAFFFFFFLVKLIVEGRLLGLLDKCGSTDGLNW